ncbi:uncharacterized protein LOC121247144 [Juglans microcarpa x Juglans regia]|uniref:uncharacterized protein LOC121247144 n=1 Tax=Juglans microcarpa x Juglans regia TaxID=2249226 RepID=UPI001B7F1BB4|nr:uncharacterized protein LOC121247144 [Juglans microcarpa x Juglans regia]
MDLWHKFLFPHHPVKPPKTGAGLLKLHNDVQSCEYQDVHVMWEMLRKSESGQPRGRQCHPKRKQRPFWRLFLWSNNHNAASSLSADQAN